MAHSAAIARHYGASRYGIIRQGVGEGGGFLLVVQFVARLQGTKRMRNVSSRLYIQQQQQQDRRVTPTFACIDARQDGSLLKICLHI